MTIRKELLDKAADLGLQFPKNISTEKLENLVLKTMEDAVTPPVVVETAALEQVAVKEAVDNKVREKMSQLEEHRKIIADAREAAFKTRVVTLTNKDNRENDLMTTAFLSFENQHFGIAKVVPLDIPVELEQALIHVAETTMVTLHKDEIVDGKRTGNRIATSVKKFAISYEQTTPTE